MCLISKESDGISFKSNKKEGQKIKFINYGDNSKTNSD